MDSDLSKLLRWARDTEVGARAEAAERLRHHVHEASAVEALIALIRDDSADVVKGAAASLKAIQAPTVEAWRAVSTGLKAESAAVRDACAAVLMSWKNSPVDVNEIITTLMALPASERLVDLIAPSELVRAIDDRDPVRVLFVARQLAVVSANLSASARLSVARRISERASGLSDPAAAKELDQIARRMDRSKKRGEARALGIRRRPWPATEGQKHYEAFRRDVWDGNTDGATDYVYMLEDADWALLEKECSTFPDDALDELISVLGNGPASGLRILANLLRDPDPDRSRAAAEAMDTMAQTRADEMAISVSEAALLQRYEISASLRSVAGRPYPDAAH